MGEKSLQLIIETTRRVTLKTWKEAAQVVVIHQYNLLVRRK